MLSTPDRQPYVEIQGGPISDQSIKLELRPGEKKNHVEYWIPTDHPLDIYSLKVPALRLRPIDRIPLFDWARKNESSIWIALADAYKNKSTLPAAPYPEDGQWAPSGMEGDRTTIHSGYRSGESFIGKAICSSAGVGKGERYLRRYPRDLVVEPTSPVGYRAG